MDATGASLAIALAPYALTAARQVAAKGATGLMAHALARTSARERYARARLRVTHEIQRRKHTMTAVTVCGALGLADAKGHKIPSYFGLDGEAWAGVAALVGGEYIGGQSGKILQSVADGLLSVAAWKLGRSAGGKPAQGTAEDAKAFDALLAAS